MTLPQASNPVLDKLFHLHTRLRETPFSATYRATHVAGHDAVVKLIYREDLFFDELARLYAMDESHFFCQCFYNYPPESVTGKPLPLNQALTQIHAGSSDHDSAAVGILVLEAPEGVRLSEIYEQLDEIEVVNFLMEVTYAMRDLAAQGIGHGALLPQNVMVNHEDAEIKIVDLGYHSEHGNYETRLLSPEHKLADEPGPLEDITMFAANFLPLLKRQKLVRKLRRACMSPDPAARPNLDEILSGLRQYRRQLHPKRTREILFGFLRPANLITWMVTIGLGIILLP